jgi:isoaspartyl peptidase/L-asparaginase-like protein (Ntn-hydrolase superfamily)
MKRLLKVTVSAAVAFGLILVSTASSQAACVTVRHVRHPVVVSRKVVVKTTTVVTTTKVVHTARPVRFVAVRVHR